MTLLSKIFRVGRFEVMDIDGCHCMSECELLEAALAQVRSDMAEGRFVRESPEEHIARLKSSM